MIRVERYALSSYASGLLAAGRGVFSADEAQKEIGISRGAGGPQSTPPTGISAPKVPPTWVSLVPVEKRPRKLANCRIERVVVTYSGENARAFGALAEERHQTVAKARPLKIAVRQHRKEFGDLVSAKGQNLRNRRSTNVLGNLIGIVAKIVVA
jgi:hypothetical protein